MAVQSAYIANSTAPMPTCPDVLGARTGAKVLALLAIGNALPTMPTPTGCWLLAAVGSANNANTYRLLAAGCWLLAAGCWLLAAGCWLLAAGCWLLAAGCAPGGRRVGGGRALAEGQR